MCTNYILMNKTIIDIMCYMVSKPNVLSYSYEANSQFFFIREDDTCIIYMWSNKGHMKWSFPLIFVFSFSKRRKYNLHMQ